MTDGPSLLSYFGKDTFPDCLAAALADGANVNVTEKQYAEGLVYRSVKEHGISLQFEHDKGCQAIDLYNKEAIKGWNEFTALPLRLSWSTREEEDAHIFTLDTTTTGKDWVEQFGEPTRKGGGGANGLGPGAWMEWQSVLVEGQMVNIMVELAGQQARGAARWDKDKGGAAHWGICTFSVAV